MTRWQTGRRLDALAEQVRAMVGGAEELAIRARRSSPVPVAASQPDEEEEDSGTYATILPGGDEPEAMALPWVGVEG